MREPAVSTHVTQQHDLLDGQFPSREMNQCPYPFFAAVRAECPVMKVKGQDHYVVSRHEDIVYVTRHPEIFSNKHSVFTPEGHLRAATLEDLEEDRPWAIATSDPPQHTRKRKITHEILKPGRLPQYEQMITTIVDEIVDGFVMRGECEFVRDFAETLPARVMWGILALPEADRDKALKWRKFEGFGFRWAPPEMQAESADIVREVAEYMRAAVLDRYENPGDDNLSEWIRAHAASNGGVLDEANVVTDATTLIFGGLATSSNMFANVMYLLLQFPEQLAAVRADHERIPHAIEEALRVESPVQQTPRICLRDTELGGVTIPAGAPVLLAWGSANRDEDVFAASDAFDIDRPELRKHIAFGHGAHFCLGAQLARLEGRIGFERLFDRVGDIRIAPGSPEIVNKDSVQNRCPSALHLQFG
jgi:cytochrome P450